VSPVKTNQEWQAEVEQLKADHAMDITLLRSQLESSQLRLATCARALKRAETILQDYLTALYPHLYAQALGARMNTVEAGEYLYQHYLYGDDPKELFGLCEARQQAEVERARFAPPPQPVVVDQGVELSGDAVKLLYVLGLVVLADEAKPMWARRRTPSFPNCWTKGCYKCNKSPRQGISLAMPVTPAMC